MKLFHHQRQVDLRRYHHLPGVPGAIGVSVYPWDGELPAVSLAGDQHPAVEAQDAAQGVEGAQQADDRVINQAQLHLQRDCAIRLEQPFDDTAQRDSNHSRLGAVWAQVDDLAGSRKAGVKGTLVCNGRAAISKIGLRQDW